MSNICEECEQECCEFIKQQKADGVYAVLSEVRALMMANKKTRFWKVTKFDVGRELADPDYVMKLEKLLNKLLSEHFA